MKRYFIIFFILPLFTACNDGKKEARENNELQLEKNDNPADTSRLRTGGELVEESATEKDGVATEAVEEDAEIAETPGSNGLEGTYTKVDANGSAAGCACYCVEVSFSTPTELCVSPEHIRISARFSRQGDQKANVFYEDVLESNDLENEIPWDSFDKTVPIATVSLQSDGSMKLDWLGFSVDGELAVDYAIYGKKTLEGTYKKQ